MPILKTTLEEKVVDGSVHRPPDPDDNHSWEVFTICEGNDPSQYMIVWKKVARIPMPKSCELCGRRMCDPYSDGLVLQCVCGKAYRSIANPATRRIEWIAREESTTA